MFRHFFKKYRVTFAIKFFKSSFFKGQERSNEQPAAFVKCLVYNIPPAANWQICNV